MREAVGYAGGFGADAWVSRRRRAHQAASRSREPVDGLRRGRAHRKEQHHRHRLRRLPCGACHQLSASGLEGDRSSTTVVAAVAARATSVPRHVLKKNIF